MKVEQRFGQNLVGVRKRAGLSQERLADLAGLHRTEIGMLERGIRLARIDTLIKLAGALEVTPDALLDGIDWRPGASRPGGFRDAGEAES
jgi:transcriptional regulator with XRE-family HTH domain